MNNLNKYDDISYFDNSKREESLMFNSFSSENENYDIVEFFIFGKKEEKKKNNWILPTLLGLGTLGALGAGGWYFRKPLMNMLGGLSNGQAKNGQGLSNGQENAAAEELRQLTLFDLSPYTKPIKNNPTPKPIQTPIQTSTSEAKQLTLFDMSPYISDPWFMPLEQLEKENKPLKEAAKRGVPIPDPKDDYWLN